MCVFKKWLWMCSCAETNDWGTIQNSIGIHRPRLRLRLRRRRLRRCSFHDEDVAAAVKHGLEVWLERTWLECLTAAQRHADGQQIIKSERGRRASRAAPPERIAWSPG